jgi:hypothetical protein
LGNSNQAPSGKKRLIPFSESDPNAMELTCFMSQNGFKGFTVCLQFNVQSIKWCRKLQIILLQKEHGRLFTEVSALQKNNRMLKMEAET